MSKRIRDRRAPSPWNASIFRRRSRPKKDRTTKWERTWAATSVATPIIGGFGAAQFLNWAVRETGEGQAWLFVLSAASLAAAAGVAIVTKILGLRNHATIADAKQKQLVKLCDELMPVAATAADMARYPLEERGPYLESVAKVAAGALARIVEEHVDRPRAVVYLLDADADPPNMKSIGHRGRGHR